jgi:hypothetical protein
MGNGISAGAQAKYEGACTYLRLVETQAGQDA